MFTHHSPWHVTSRARGEISSYRTRIGTGQKLESGSSRAQCRHFKPQGRTSKRSADDAVGGCAAACDGVPCTSTRGRAVRVIVRDWVVGFGRDQGRDPLIRDTREPCFKSRGRHTCRSEAASIEPPSASDDSASGAATEAAVPAASATSPSCSPGGARCLQPAPHGSLFLRQ